MSDVNNKYDHEKEKDIGVEATPMVTEREEGESGVVLDQVNSDVGKDKSDVIMEENADCGVECDQRSEIVVEKVNIYIH